MAVWPRPIAMPTPKPTAICGVMWRTPMMMCPPGNMPYTIWRALHCMHAATARSKKKH